MALYQNQTYDPNSWLGGTNFGSGANAGGGFDLTGLGNYGAPTAGVAAGTPAAAALKPAGANPGSFELGANLGTAQLALGGLSSLGSIWSAFNAQKLAKKQFDYTKSVTDTNLANSIQSYNTTLADRARARGAMEGQSQAQQDAYVAQNSLRRQ